jgi:hypothetical protein
LKHRRNPFAQLLDTNGAVAWAEENGRECGVAFAEGFRQHLSHAYPQEPLLQEVLAPLVYERLPST